MNQGLHNIDDVASTIYQRQLDAARHLIGCHLNRGIRVKNAFDDLATTSHQSLPTIIAVRAANSRL